MHAKLFHSGMLCSDSGDLTVPCWTSFSGWKSVELCWVIQRHWGSSSKAHTFGRVALHSSSDSPNGSDDKDKKNKGKDEKDKNKDKNDKKDKDKEEKKGKDSKQKDDKKNKEKKGKDDKKNKKKRKEDEDDADALFGGIGDDDDDEDGGADQEDDEQTGKPAAKRPAARRPGKAHTKDTKPKSENKTKGKKRACDPGEESGFDAMVHGYSLEDIAGLAENKSVPPRPNFSEEMEDRVSLYTFLYFIKLCIIFYTMLYHVLAVSTNFIQPFWSCKSNFQDAFHWSGSDSEKTLILGESPQSRKDRKIFSCFSCHLLSATFTLLDRTEKPARRSFANLL